MAIIKYSIDFDASKNATVVVCTVQQIDPGDVVVVTTTTPNAALQLIESPFAAPAAEKIYLIPHENADPQHLKVEKSSDLSLNVVQCGEADNDGLFKQWPGGGIQPGGGTNRPVGPSGL